VHAGARADRRRADRSAYGTDSVCEVASGASVGARQRDRSRTVFDISEEAAHCARTNTEGLLQRQERVQGKERLRERCEQLVQRRCVLLWTERVRRTEPVQGHGHIVSTWCDPYSLKWQVVTTVAFRAEFSRARVLECESKRCRSSWR